MNTTVFQQAKRQVLHFARADADSQASGISPVYFGKAARHKCLEPGRYLMLMREYHGKSNSRRAGRYGSLGAS